MNTEETNLIWNKTSIKRVSNHKQIYNVLVYIFIIINCVRKELFTAGTTLILLFLVDCCCWFLSCWTLLHITNSVKQMRIILYETIQKNTCGLIIIIYLNKIFHFSVLFIIYSYILIMDTLNAIDSPYRFNQELDRFFRFFVSFWDWIDLPQYIFRFGRWLIEDNKRALNGIATRIWMHLVPNIWTCFYLFFFFFVVFLHTKLTVSGMNHSEFLFK